jgi:hypothetical protein
MSECLKKKGRFPLPDIDMTSFNGFDDDDDEDDDDDDDDAELLFRLHLCKYVKDHTRIFKPFI